VIVAGINVLPFEDAPEVIDAQAVMEELTPPEVDLPIEAIEREDASPLAFVDQSNETDDGYVYVTMLDDETFGLVVTSAGAGQLEAQIPTILAMIDTLSVDFGVTLEEGAAERYADYTQSQSEDGYPQLGEEDAPVVVVEISSFDCPACRFFHDEVFPLILERVEAGEVLFQYVPVYVYGTGGIPAGDAAARATFCASEQDAFWPYHDLIFDWQEFGQLAFSGTRLANGAEALGLDTEAFAECMASERPDEYLDAVLEYAFGLEEFAGTPTVFVNGEQVSNSAEAIINLIDSQLADSE
jgi:protein-disulfide isomerase